LRYQTTNDRAFHKCVDQLVKIRAQRFKEAIGFERQQQQMEAEQQKLSRERERAEVHQNRERQRADRHKLAVSLAEAKLDHQALLNARFDNANPLAFAAANRIAELEKAA
ncbi:MAG: hypothetical protein ACRD4O_16290, partial [Bryobacteraceae bacterium]